MVCQADRRRITGLAYDPSGPGRVVTIGRRAWLVRAGSTLKLTVALDATSKALLRRFGRIPVRLTITPAYNGYALTASGGRTVFES